MENKFVKGLHTLFPVEAYFYIAAFTLVVFPYANELNTAYLSGNFLSASLIEDPVKAFFPWPAQVLAALFLEGIYIFSDKKRPKIIRKHPVLLFFLTFLLCALYRVVALQYYPSVGYILFFKILIFTALFWIATRFSPIAYLWRRHIEDTAKEKDSPVTQSSSVAKTRTELKTEPALVETTVEPNPEPDLAVKTERDIELILEPEPEPEPKSESEPISIPAPVTEPVMPAEPKPVSEVLTKSESLPDLTVSESNVPNKGLVETNGSLEKTLKNQRSFSIILCGICLLLLFSLIMSVYKNNELTEENTALSQKNNAFKEEVLIKSNKLELLTNENNRLEHDLSALRYNSPENLPTANEFQKKLLEDALSIIDESTKDFNAILYNRNFFVKSHSAYTKAKNEAFYSVAARLQQTREAFSTFDEKSFNEAFQAAYDCINVFSQAYNWKRSSAVSLALGNRDIAKSLADTRRTFENTISLHLQDMFHLVELFLYHSDSEARETLLCILERLYDYCQPYVPLQKD